MATVHLRESTTASAEGFIAALTDFGPRRGEIFAYSQGDSLKVNARGDTWADVTEGSAGGAWERLRYDWSQPNVVRLTTVDSNIWSPGSGWTYTLAPRCDGRTDVDLIVAHRGRNAKGRVAAGLIAIFGRWVLGRDLRRTLRAIERG